MMSTFAVMIRVVNPAYPESIMLVILFMNVVAPLIDYPIVRANVNYQAVMVPPGRHAVGFVFRPASVRWGSWSALAGVSGRRARSRSARKGRIRCAWT